RRTFAFCWYSGNLFIGFHLSTGYAEPLLICVICGSDLKVFGTREALRCVLADSPRPRESLELLAGASTLQLLFARRTSTPANVADIHRFPKASSVLASEYDPRVNEN